MIIEVKKIKEVEFRTLDYGDVFEHHGDIYMVTPFFTDDEEETSNAIDLSSGNAVYFFADAKVVPLPKARLIIED
jgi:hypothetical protein